MKQYTLSSLFIIFGFFVTLNLFAIGPAAPTNVNAIADNGQAIVFFTPSSGATSYTVTSNIGGFSVSGAGTVLGAGTYLIVTGLSNNTNYKFAVTATNIGGTSVASDSSAICRLIAGVSYYYYNSGNLDNLSSWSTAIGSVGNGTHPTSFTASNQVFDIISGAGVNSYSSSSATWTVSGTGSSVQIGNVSTTLYIPANNAIAGTVSVANASTLQVESNVNPPFTAGTFSATPSSGAACIYDGTGTQYLSAGDYTGGLSVSGTSNTVSLNGDII